MKKCPGCHIVSNAEEIFGYLNFECLNDKCKYYGCMIDYDIATDNIARIFLHFILDGKEYEFVRLNKYKNLSLKIIRLFNRTIFEEECKGNIDIETIYNEAKKLVEQAHKLSLFK